MYEVTNRTASPYRSIVYLEAIWADGSTSRASGVIVGYNDVLTALHTVYDASLGGWARGVSVMPAADTQPWSEPFGTFRNIGSMVGRASNWDLNGDGYLTQAESAGDIALLGMTTRIGDITGWLPVRQQPNDFYGVMAGYPVNQPGLMAEQVFADAASSHTVYNIASGLGAGASGGPLLETVDGIHHVVGVLSGGNHDDSSSTFAGLFSGSTWSWLQDAMAANDSLLGYRPPTSVLTASGGLIVSGGAGDDVLVGGPGWDVFSGGGGSDTIQGGAGIDLAIYTGSRGAYVTTVTPGGITVADTVAARDGTDTLHDVERLKFADVSLAFDTGGSAGQAYRLYKTVFARVPDAAGLGFHMKSLDDGWALSQVANSFIQSPEFLRSFAGLTDEQFVNQLYQYALGRPADADGFEYHAGNLRTGANTRADVVVGFSESPENQASVIGVIQHGMTYVA